MLITPIILITNEPNYTQLILFKKQQTDIKYHKQVWRFCCIRPFLVGVFEENARLLQWLVFFVSSTRSVHFFVLLFNIINLNYGRPKHTRNARTSSKTKQKYRRPEPRKHRTPPFGVFHSDFFRHYATFLNFFGFHQRVSLSFVSIFCNTMDVKKSPFYNFET